MSTHSGAWSRRARLAAVEGSPMPTKHVMSLRRQRAALTIITSSALTSGTGGLRLPAEAGEVLGEVGRSADVLVDPGRERAAVTADVVPRPVELVVPRGVADGEAGVGAARHLAHRAHHPGRQHDGVGPGRELVDDLLDGDDGSAR